jgi:hypothetical protein
MHHVLNILESAPHERILYSTCVDNMVVLQIDEVGASLSPFNFITNNNNNNNSVTLVPRENCTERATAACRRS